MNITSILYEIVLIILGSFLLYGKYKVVLGGTLYTATLKDCTKRKTLNRGNWYKYYVEFRHEQDLVIKKTYLATLFSSKKIGDKLEVYYNTKYPDYVVYKTFKIEIIAAFLILTAVYHLIF